MTAPYSSYCKQQKGKQKQSTSRLQSRGLSPYCTEVLRAQEECQDQHSHRRAIPNHPYLLKWKCTHPAQTLRGKHLYPPPASLLPYQLIELPRCSNDTASQALSVMGEDILCSSTALFCRTLFFSFSLFLKTSLLGNYSS